MRHNLYARAWRDHNELTQLLAWSSALVGLPRKRLSLSTRSFLEKFVRPCRSKACRYGTNATSAMGLRTISHLTTHTSHDAIKLLACGEHILCDRPAAAADRPRMCPTTQARGWEYLAKPPIASNDMVGAERYALPSDLCATWRLESRIQHLKAWCRTCTPISEALVAQCQATCNAQEQNLRTGRATAGLHPPKEEPNRLATPHGSNIVVAHDALGAPIWVAATPMSQFGFARLEAVGCKSRAMCKVGGLGCARSWSGPAPHRRSIDNSFRRRVAV